MLALAIVISIGVTLFDTLRPGPEPDIANAVGILLGAFILLALSLRVPALAAALVSGGPRLGAETLSQPAAQIGRAAIGLGAAATGAAGLAGAASVTGGGGGGGGNAGATGSTGSEGGPPLGGGPGVGAFAPGGEPTAPRTMAESLDRIRRQQPPPPPRPPQSLDEAAEQIIAFQKQERGEA
jgi:type IV secretion system protein TrbL